MAIDMKMVMGMVVTATPATLIGSMSRVTMTTEAMVMSSSVRNSVTDSSTTSLWSVITLICTSGGRVS